MKTMKEKNEDMQATRFLCFYVNKHHIHIILNGCLCDIRFFLCCRNAFKEIIKNFLPVTYI